MRRAILVGSVLCIAACGSGVTPSERYTVRDSSGIRIAENVVPGERPVCAVSGPVTTLGVTSGGEGHELYRVFGARRLSDGRIVLVNQGSQEIRFFDGEGTFLSSSGREGEGPGEFRDAFLIWVTAGDTLWVGDYRPWQFHVFDPQGLWIRTVRPRPELINTPAVAAILDSGRSVLASSEYLRGYEAFEPRQITVVLYDVDGAPLDTVGVYPHGRWGQLGDDPRASYVYPFFESFTWLDGAGDRWFVGNGASAELTVFRSTPEPTLEGIIRWTAGDRTVLERHVAAERARLRAQYADLEPAIARQLLEPLVSPERPVADQLPAFNDVVANRSGGVWVREYPEPGQPLPRHWLAFDRDGRFTCQVALPDVDVVDIGDGYVLTEQETELGVEQVVLYEVGLPPIGP